jgi:hypothetical protein
MKLLTTPRTDFLRGIATEVLHNYARGRSIVAVDGADSSGRSAVADDLAEVFAERDHPVYRASLRYFQRPSQELEQLGADTPERHYRFGYDYSALRRVLIEPFRMGGSTGFVTRHFDPERGTWIQPTWITAPTDATLILDGEFLNRAELRGLWSWSMLVESDAAGERSTGETSTGETSTGESSTVETSAASAMQLYSAEDDPRSRSAAVVDVTDPDNPRRRFLDSC